MKKFENAVFNLSGNILNSDQKNFFAKYGVIQFKGFVSRDTIKEITEEIDRVQAGWIEDNVTKINGVPLKYGKDHENRPMIQRLAFASHYSPLLREFLKDSRLGALLPLLGVEDGRIGENEKDGLVVNQYINSPFSEHKKMGWHTDSPRDLFLGSRINPMLNVGLHLDDCPSSNGGLRVLPGTQNQSLFSLLFKKRYFIDNRPDPEEFGFEIEAGDLTVHDGRLWHRVEQSPATGLASRRRVMYIPFVAGAYAPKSAESPTPFYHKVYELRKLRVQHLIPSNRLGFGIGLPKLFVK